MVVGVTIEWFSPDEKKHFHAFFGEEHIGFVKECEYEVPESSPVWETGESQYFQAYRPIGKGPFPEPIPGRFLYRGEAIAALIKEMSLNRLATQCYLEV